MASYKVLFTIQLNHAYYTSGVSPDFRVVPDAETTALLRKYRLLFRTSETGATVVYEAKDGTADPVIGFEAEKRFRFYLQPNNSQFNTFTKLPGLDFGKLYYFKNPSSKVPVDSDALRYFPLAFKYNISGTELTIAGPENNASNPATVLDEEGLTAGDQQVNLRAYGTGMYAVSETPENILVDSGADGSYMAVVECFLSTHPTGGNPTAYSINFEARAQVWKYYVVFPNSLTDPVRQYAIQTGTTMAFTEIVDADTSGTPEEIAAIANLKTGKYAAGKVVLFRSTDNGSGAPEIAYAEQPVQAIVLHDTTNVETVVANLPNPSVNNVSADMVVYAIEK